MADLNLSATLLERLVTIMIHVSELRTATSFVVIVDKSSDDLKAKVTALRDIFGDTVELSGRGVVDSDDLAYAFNKIGFNDWDRG